MGTVVVIVAPKLQKCVQGNVVLYIFWYYIPPLFKVLQIGNSHLGVKSALDS